MPETVKCVGCKNLVSVPPGAAQFKCSRCGAVMAGQLPTVTCYKCFKPVGVPPGAPQFRCTHCSAVMQAPPAQQPQSPAQYPPQQYAQYPSPQSYPNPPQHTQSAPQIQTQAAAQLPPYLRTESAPAHVQPPPYQTPYPPPTTQQAPRQQPPAVFSSPPGNTHDAGRAFPMSMASQASKPYAAASMQPGGWTEIPEHELRLGSKIGGGAFKTVYRGEWRGTPVAIGSLISENASQADIDDLRKELQLLQSLHHPNVVQLLGAVTDPRARALLIVTELMDRGSLYDCIYKQKSDWRRHKGDIMCDVVSGLNFLHQSQVAHRDIKTLNILVDNKYTAKLTDFGLSRKKTGVDVTTMAQTKVGSMLYMAPELMQGLSYNPFKSDVWATGLVIYEIVQEELPFADLENPFQMMMAVVQQKRVPVLQPGHGCPPQLCQLLQRLCAYEPERRPTMPQVLAEMRQLHAAHQI